LHRWKRETEPKSPRPVDGVELAQARQRIRGLEQANEVLRLLKRYIAREVYYLLRNQQRAVNQASSTLDKQKCVHGTQFTSWVFGEKIRSAGLLPSFGTGGDGLDNTMMESFWSSMQIELLNRQRWKTRVELANATFDYIEIFHNRQRRHSALGYLTPIEYELRSNQNTITAAS
jgi:transposase InsO family protein